jgi:hypothetical protein
MAHACTCTAIVRRIDRANARSLSTLKENGRGILITILALYAGHVAKGFRPTLHRPASIGGKNYGFPGCLRILALVKVELCQRRNESGGKLAV